MQANTIRQETRLPLKGRQSGRACIVIMTTSGLTSIPDQDTESRPGKWVEFNGKSIGSYFLQQNEPNGSTNRHAASTQENRATLHA